MTGEEKDVGRYDRPILIGDGIYWIGVDEEYTELHCNPYMIVEEGDAVIIDCGTRPQFPTVMMKILMTGMSPGNIKALIYSHYDPDLCGSMPNVIDMCAHEDLAILSQGDNILFINSYIEKQYHRLVHRIDDLGYKYELNGRVLEFYRTPYCHTSGSFVTYDRKTGTLFSGDLFGSFSRKWELFLDFEEHCPRCTGSPRLCTQSHCPLDDVCRFHQQLMPSTRALHYAMGTIKELDVELVAPQHGSIIKGKSDIHLVISKLESLESTGAERP